MHIHLAAVPSLAEDFTDFQLVDESPDAVVMGDLHKDFTWERLDSLFRMVHGGAQLVALHKNRYCRRDIELSLDLGPFVAALEYATNTQALVVGKPSKPFFFSAVADMGLTTNEVVMVGDDLEADIGGALDAGFKAVQVKTGKYSAHDDDHTEVRPTARIASIADLPAWLDTL
jgi:HAD superfamily hydrolase (TIGR01458 family)